MVVNNRRVLLDLALLVSISFPLVIAAISLNMWGVGATVWESLPESVRNNESEKKILLGEVTKSITGMAVLQIACCGTWILLSVCIYCVYRWKNNRIPGRATGDGASGDTPP